MNNKPYFDPMQHLLESPKVEWVRRLYLIRHAQPVSAHNTHRCISETDNPLDETGVYQAERLGEWAQTVPLTAVFSSPLERCIQTAQIMCPTGIPVQICDQLREMSVGKWENLTFDDIRAQYPKEYAARGEHPGSVPPPGGESFDHAGVRLLACITSLLAVSQGAIAIVAHGGVNRGALCRLMGLHPDKVLTIAQPWGGINTICIDSHGHYIVASIGRKPVLLGCF